MLPASLTPRWRYSRGAERSQRPASDIRGGAAGEVMPVSETLPPTSASALPLSSHGKPVDSFERAAELERELQRTVRGEVRFDRGSRALVRHRRLELPADPDRRRRSQRRRRRPRRGGGVPAARRATASPGRGHEPRRPVLQRRGRARLHQVHEPHSRGRPRRIDSPACNLASCSIRCGARAEATPSDIRSRPFNAQPLQPGRHDRQQLLRHALPARRQDRRQRPRAADSAL